MVFTAVIRFSEYKIKVISLWMKFLRMKPALRAKEPGFRKLYLFAFDPVITNYYQRFGWKKIGCDEFKSHTVTVMEMSTM